MAQVVRNLPVMQETQVQPLDHENPLEEGMATHFSILACEIPWTEEPGGLQSMGLQGVKHDLATKYTCARVHTHTYMTVLCIKLFSM